MDPALTLPAKSDPELGRVDPVVQDLLVAKGLPVFADLDIDTSEVSNHFPDAGKMVLKSATTTGDQFVDANKMIDAKNPAMRRNQIADVSKKVESAKSRTADGDV